MLYGIECWAVKNQHENKLSVAEMRCCVGCVVRLGKIELEMTTLDGERVGVSPIVEKMVETILRWFGHVKRRHVDDVVRIVDHMEGRQITRARGRPKKTIKKDLAIN